MTPINKSLQDVAHTAEHEKDKHGKGRDRLNLTVFLHEDGSVRIYTSQIGTSNEVCEPSNPLCVATIGSRRPVPSASCCA